MMENTEVSEWNWSSCISWKVGRRWNLQWPGAYKPHNSHDFYLVVPLLSIYQPYKHIVLHQYPKEMDFFIFYFFFKGLKLGNFHFILLFFSCMSKLGISQWILAYIMPSFELEQHGCNPHFPLFVQGTKLIFVCFWLSSFFIIYF